jgi:hypothetical protein
LILHITSVDRETDGMRAMRLKLGADETAPTRLIQELALVVCLQRMPWVDIHREAGTTRVIDAGIRSMVNLSTKPIEMLFMERKQ